MENPIFNEKENDMDGFDVDLIGLLASKPTVTNFYDHVSITLILETGDETQKITVLCNKFNQNIPKLTRDPKPVGKIVYIKNVNKLEGPYFFADIREQIDIEIAVLEYNNLRGLKEMLKSFTEVSFKEQLNHQW